MLTLPLWFLVIAIIWPRITLFMGWLWGWAFPVPFLLDGLLWVFVPRLLVLLLIVSVMGICPWFWIHLGAAALAWTFGFVRSRDFAARKKA